MELSNCATCGVLIGGQNHVPLPGFIPVSGVTDTTQTGHILGNAENRSEAPNRNLPLAQSCVLRMCLHLAMLQGAIHHQQVQRKPLQHFGIQSWLFVYQLSGKFIFVTNYVFYIFSLATFSRNKLVTVVITSHRASGI